MTPTEGTAAKNIAWAFAGQGSQIPGMGKDIYEEYPQTRPIFESTAAGFDLKSLCFEASAETLADTRYTQASMAAFAAAAVLLLKEGGVGCDAALGLSLGEYSALHAAGVFDAEALLALLGFRGAIMADASNVPSSMVAVFGLADEEVEAAAAQVASSTGAIVSCTNFNCPGQVVIGGDADAVAASVKLLSERGAKRCIPLNTSGPFHTAFMLKPGELLKARLEETDLMPQAFPVIFNATAASAPDSEIRGLLVAQISSPVRFAQSILTLEGRGITDIIEVGPGKVLAGLIKKTAPSIKVTSIQTAADIKAIVEGW